MMIRFSILCCFIFALSCKNAEKPVEENNEVAALELVYKASPTPENFNLLLQGLGSAIMEEGDKAKKEALIIKSIDLCKETNNTAYINTFAIELIKLNPKSKISKEYLLIIAEDMKASQKYEVANILMKGYSDLYPDDVKTKRIKDSISVEYSNLNGLIKGLATKIFENPDVNGINKVNSEKYVDVCESYALVYSNDTLSADYLFKAAEITRALKSYGKTISLYDWITTYYPNHKHAPMALFLKGFLLENDLKNPDKAKEIYQSFIDRYPNNAMVNDVKFLISNIGKSDKQIIDEIEKSKPVLSK